MFIRAIKKYGISGVIRRLPIFFFHDLGLKNLYINLFFRSADTYSSPTGRDIEDIEKQLRNCSIQLFDLYIDVKKFKDFCRHFQFPDDYHGGLKDPVRNEKLLEHYLAYEFIGIEKLDKQSKYIDVAACSSPWVKMLREKKLCESIAIDLEILPRYLGLDYYIKMDATSTEFENASVSGASLQCAYEMFRGEDDIKLIEELARVLKPGGRAVISPLYMHTHYCNYSSIGYFGKGYGDSSAREYLQPQAQNIPSSRKYSAKVLKSRILDKVQSLGMTSKLYAIRNKEEIGDHIYCHFILVIER